MPGPWKYLTRIHILIGNVFVCLISDPAVGHWQDPKDRANGVRDVLEGSEEEFFGRGIVSGPFEDPSMDTGTWLNHIGGSGGAAKEGMADIGEGLLEGAEEVGLLAGDKKFQDKTGAGSDRYKEKNWKQNAEAVRNWSGYLEDMRKKWDKAAPSQPGKGTASDFGGKGGADGNGKMSGFLKRLRTGAIKSKTGPGNCDQTELDKQIMRRIQESLAESFVYRNITLSDINRMTKIIDFVERYHGRIRGFGDPRRDKSGALPGGHAAGSVIAPPV